MFLCICPYSSFQPHTNEGLSSLGQTTSASVPAACKAAHQTPQVQGEINHCRPGWSGVWANTGEEAQPGTCVQLLEQTQHGDEVGTSLVLLWLGRVLETTNDICLHPRDWGQHMCVVQSFPCQRPGLWVLPILPWGHGPPCWEKTVPAGKAACCRGLCCYSGTTAFPLYLQEKAICLAIESCRRSLNCLWRIILTGRFSNWSHLLYLIPVCVHILN